MKKKRDADFSKLDLSKWAIYIMAGSTFLTAFGQLFWKFAMERMIDISLFNLVTNYFLYIGFFMYLFGAFFMVIALKHGDLSVLYPVVSLSFIWVTVLAFLFLGEHIDSFRMLGLVFILLGVSFLGKSAKVIRREKAES